MLSTSWVQIPLWAWLSILTQSLCKFCDSLFCLADGAAGLNARCAQQPRNLLQMKLDRIRAQNLCLRKAEPGMPHGIHAAFKIGDILLKIDCRRHNIEDPFVNAARDVVKA